MITASEARKLYQKHLYFEKEVMQILDTIGKRIEVACETDDNLHWEFDDTVNDEVISSVISRLQQLGYDVRWTDRGERLDISW